jgi:flagellar FliL protein
MRIVIALLATSLAIAWLPHAAANEPAEGAKTNSRGYEYVELKPSIVVNLGSTGRVAFLKADVSLRVASPARTAVEENMPAIRHELIMLLSRQDEAAVSGAETREALRLSALAAVREELAGLSGIEPGQVQDLLFTSFMTQR